MNYTNLNTDSNKEINPVIKNRHNIQIAKSPLLAKAILYGIPFKDLEHVDFDGLTAIIAECENRTNMKNIQDSSVEQTEKTANPLHENKDYHRYGELMEELIEQANAYNIPYDPRTVEFSFLENAVEEYEILLEQAKENHINWDPSDYDPNAIIQLLEEKEARAREEINELYWYYNSTRL